MHKGGVSGASVHLIPCYSMICYVVEHFFYGAKFVARPILQVNGKGECFHVIKYKNTWSKSAQLKAVMSILKCSYSRARFSTHIHT